MIDIVNFNGEKFNLGFSEVYSIKDFNIVLGSKNNRKTAGNKEVDILLSPEIGSNGKTLIMRDSGLNDVICKLAKKNQVAVGFSFSSILNSKNRVELLANMMQNIRLCRKYKVIMVMASFAHNKYEMRHGRDLLNFCKVLGMGDGEAKNALNFEKKKNMPRFV